MLVLRDDKAELAVLLLHVGARELFGVQGHCLANEARAAERQGCIVRGRESSLGLESPVQMVANRGIRSVCTDKYIAAVPGVVGAVNGHALIVLVERHDLLAHVHLFTVDLAQEKAVKVGARYDILDRATSKWLEGKDA